MFFFYLPFFLTQACYFIFFHAIVIMFILNTYVVVNFFPQVIFSFLLLLWMVMSVKQRKTSITTKESQKITYNTYTLIALDFKISTMQPKKINDAIKLLGMYKTSYSLPWIAHCRTEISTNNASWSATLKLSCLTVEGIIIHRIAVVLPESRLTRKGSTRTCVDSCEYCL